MLRQDKVKELLKQNYVLIPVRNNEIDLYPEELELLRAFFRISKRTELDEFAVKERIYLVLEKKL